MSAFGRITNSLLSGTNENSIQLATFNFDFSLLKVEAPEEFKALGSVLSTRRRRDAEEGPPHRTARRLGALFEDRIPATPRLIEAFGKRVSEVVQTPGISPQGTPVHGPFEQFVGADGTTLWAAATSSIPSIGVYLLSCLLARVWDAKEATALWVELVKQRKLEIENSNIVSAAALFNAHQEISRDDLARWDNSARSWMRSADLAKPFQRSQLLLIEKNLYLPLLSETSTYESIINVWHQAMIGLEALLCGTPIEVSDGALFLAFSSWHLYPDLIVLGNETKPVRFRDGLFPPGGRVTVRQEATVPNLSGGLKWSLTFSHLKYYGDPVVTRNHQDFSRVTFQELKLVILGSLFHEWRVNVREHILTAQWLLSIWDILGQVQPQGTDIRGQFGWLKLFVDAAMDLANTTSQASKTNSQLVQFGQRRAKSFLNDTSTFLAPFFGICTPLHLSALSQAGDWNCGIGYLRRMAKELKLKEHNSIVCYALEAERCNHPSKVKEFAVVTAVPHSQATRKRDSSGDFVWQDLHARWFISRCDPQDGRNPFALNYVDAKYTAKGEYCFRTTTTNSVCDHKTFSWPQSPYIFTQTKQEKCPSLSRVTEYEAKRCHCFQGSSKTTAQPVKFRLIYGDWRLGLYVREPSSDNETSAIQLKASTEAKRLPNTPAGLQAFAQAKINPSTLADYLSLITMEPSKRFLKSESSSSFEKSEWYKKRAPGISMLAAQSFLPECFLKSIFSLDLAAKVYENLSDATVSLTVISQPIYNSTWIPNPWREPLARFDPNNGISADKPLFQSARPVSLDLSHSFACIAKFESGSVDLDAADITSTLALSSGDSIFVAGIVLSDPFDPPAPHDIRRIVGNIGNPGISLLVAPIEPKIRKATNAFNVVAHVPYDFRREDNFNTTSLHLSFTDWKYPLEARGDRTIDQDVMMVESVISVLDRGKWIADLDIMCIDFDGLSRVTSKCEKHEQGDHDSNYDYFSVDNWDELLDAPEGVGVFRAHGNWAARLAAVSILSQQDQGHSIGVFGKASVCFKCFEEERGSVNPELLDHESALPSFCID